MFLLTSGFLILYCQFPLLVYVPSNAVDAFPSTNAVTNLGNISQQQQRLIKEVVPLEARNFYDNLTTTDRELLQRVLNKAPDYTSFGEVLTDLRNGSTTLYDKAVNLVVDLRKTVAQLSPEARNFVDQSVEQIRTSMDQTFSLELLKTQANMLVQRFRALDTATKEELRGAFPMVSAVLDNSIIQMLATGILGIQNEE